MHAKLKNVRISARKIGLAAKLVRGMKATRAVVVLKFAEKKSANILCKLLESAMSNAKNKGEKPEELKISEIFVGPGITMKRFSPRAKGSAYTILKKTSNVLLKLTHMNPTNAKKENPIKVEEESEKAKMNTQAEDDYDLFKEEGGK